MNSRNFYKRRNKIGKNKWEIEGDIAKVYFRSGGFFLCDAEDLRKIVDEHTWHKNTNGYAVTCINYKHVSLHIFLLGKQEGLEIDHINRNRLDNRKSNLRHVTHSVNMQNRTATSIYTRGINTRCCGIYPSSNKKGFKAFIHIKENKKRTTIYLGTFKSYEEAYKARKSAEAFYWGRTG